MKKYKNYSNKKIIILFYISIILSLVQQILDEEYIYKEGMFLFLIIQALIITFNIKETYLINDERIVRKKLFKKVILWSIVKEVVITDWYIKITSIYGNRFKILKKKKYYDLFEEIKMEILFHADDNKIIFKPVINEDTLTREGGIRLLFARIFANNIFIVSIIVFIIELFKAHTALEYISFGLQITIYVAIIICTIYLISQFYKNKEKAKLQIVQYFWLAAIALSILNVLTFLQSIDMITFNSVAKQLLGIIGFVIDALIVKEYIESSNRVKHYFVIK